MTTAAGYVVTGGGRGVGRAIVERLLADDAYVAVIELEEAALKWTASRPAGGRVIRVGGSAADEDVTAEAVERVEAEAQLRGGSTTLRCSVTPTCMRNRSERSST